MQEDLHTLYGPENTSAGIHLYMYSQYTVSPNCTAQSCHDTSVPVNGVWHPVREKHNGELLYAL